MDTEDTHLLNTKVQNEVEANDEKPPTPLKAKIFIIIGVIFLVFTAACVALALGAHFGLGTLINEGIRTKKQLLPGSDALRDWESNVNNSVGIFNYFSMFNLTNPQEVLKGAKPVYEELPPVVYRKYTERFNVTVSRDTNTITYYEQEYFIHQEAMSKISKDAPVYGVNPSYLAVMQQTGGEKELLSLMTGTVIGTQIFPALVGQLPQIAIPMSRALVLNSPKTNPFEVIVETTNYTMDQVYSLFSESLVIPEDPGNLFRFILISVGADSPAGIPLETVKELFNSQKPYAIAHLDFTFKEYDVWTGALAGNAANRTFLMNTFNLNDDQFNRIANWIPRFTDGVAWPWLSGQYKSKYNIPLASSPDDLGYLQWGQGKGVPLVGGSVKPLMKLPGYPEIFYFAQQELGIDFSFDIPTSKRLQPLFTQEKTVEFMKNVAVKNFDAIEKEWGINKNQSVVVMQYMTYIQDAFIATTLQETIFDNNYGLISKRSIEEWMLKYDDPLLELLGMSEKAKAATIIHNQTSKDEVYRTTRPAVMNTGGVNLTWVGQYEQDNGTAVLGLWNEPVRIKGTGGDIFQPDLQSDTDVWLWFSTLLRPQHFETNSTVEHEGITTRRFMLTYNMTLPNPIFNNKFYGLANMSVLGSPVYIGKFYFLDSNKTWAERIDGMKKPERMRDDTIIDVEPITGISMYARKRIQINLYLEPETKWFNKFNPNIPLDIMFPLVKVEEGAEITKELADEFKSTVVKAMLVQTILYWIGVSFAIVFGLVGSISLLYGFTVKSRAQHSSED